MVLVDLVAPDPLALHLHVLLYSFLCAAALQKLSKHSRTQPRIDSPGCHSQGECFSLRLAVLQ